MEFSTFVINLPRRRDRIAHLEKQALPPYSLVNGVDLSVVDSQQYFELLLWYLRGEDSSCDSKVIIEYADCVRLHLREFCSSMRDGEDLRKSLFQIQLIHLEGIIGCARSHWSIWQKVADNSYPGMVFEDDVVIGSATSDFLLSGQMNLPEQWDIVYLNGPNRFDVELCTKSHSEKFRLVEYDSRRTYQTFSYLISPRCAQTYIDHIAKFGVNNPIDWFMNVLHHERALKYYMLEPDLGLLTSHGRFSSDVQPV